MEDHDILLQLSYAQEQVLLQGLLRYQTLTDMVHPPVNTFNQVGIPIDAGLEYGKKDIKAVIFRFSCHRFQTPDSLSKCLNIALPVSEQDIALQYKRHVLNRKLHIRRDKAQVNLNCLL